MRTKKAVINVIVMSLYEIISMVCGLILPRFILVAFGSQYNGITSSITQFVGFIQILNVGIPGATRVALYKTLAANDNEATSAVLKATEGYIKKISVFFLGYLVVLAIVFPTISGATFSWLEIFSLVIIMGLGTFAQYFFGITYQILLSADQRQYIYFLLQSIVIVINTALSVALIKAGASIQTVKFGSAIIFVVTPIVLNIYVSHKYKINKKCKPDYSALKQRWDVFALGLANVVHNNTDIIVLTVFTRTEVVSVYSVYNLAIGGLKKILDVFTTGLEAAFGNMFAKGEQDAIERNFRIYEYMIFSFITIIFSCTTILILPFVQLYTQGVTDYEYIWPIYAAITVLATAFYCARMPYLTLVQAAGHYKQTRNGAFVEAGINLGLSVLLVMKYGLVGVAIGTLAADIFRTVQYALYACKYLVNISIWRIVLRVVWTAMNVAVILWGASFISSSLVFGTWVEWLFNAVLFFVMACGVTMLSSFIFYRNDMQMLVGKMTRMLKKKV